MKELRERYVGDVAISYEAERAETKQWKREGAALATVLDAIQPLTVIDVPCGTGRFFDLYQSRNIQADGVDVSTDMLDMARQKGWGAVYSGDIFDLNTPNGAFDLAVCFRLLNWMTQDECVAALSELARVAPVVCVSMSIGEGKNGRTVAHPRSVFERAGLTVIGGDEIRRGPTWEYGVITAEVL